MSLRKNPLFEQMMDRFEAGERHTASTLAGALDTDASTATSLLRSAYGIHKIHICCYVEPTNGTGPWPRMFALGLEADAQKPKSLREKTQEKRLARLEKLQRQVEADAARAAAPAPRRSNVDIEKARLTARLKKLAEIEQRKKDRDRQRAEEKARREALAAQPTAPLPSIDPLFAALTRRS